MFHCRKRVTKMMRSIRRSRNISNKKLRNNVLTPLGESAEHFLPVTGLFEEPIRKEEGKDPARPNCRHFRVMLQPGRWAILRCTWVESG